MKRFQILGVALVAVFAFSVVIAASASAATFLLAEWLVNGTAVTTEKNVEAEGTILLQDLNAPGGASDIVCSDILMGTIGEDGLDVISEMLMLDKVTVVSLLALTEPGIPCEKVTGICEEPLVWPVNLPWNTLLELMEDGTEKFFAVLIENSGAGQPGWYLHCMKTILEPRDECLAPGTSNGVFQLTLEGGTLLLGTFSEVFTLLAGESNAECSLPAEKGGAGVVESIPQEDRLAEGGTLSASSESEEA